VRPQKQKKQRSSPSPTGEMGQWHPTLNTWASPFAVQFGFFLVETDSSHWIRLVSH